MNEKELLIDCLGRLNRSGIEYMLTGSMASNYWGIPRTTHDLDFVMRMAAKDVPVLVAHFALVAPLQRRVLFPVLVRVNQVSDLDLVDTEYALAPTSESTIAWPAVPEGPTPSVSVSEGSIMLISPNVMPV